MKLDYAEIMMAVASDNWYEAAGIIQKNSQGPICHKDLSKLPVIFYGMNSAEAAAFGSIEIRVWILGCCSYWNYREGFGEEVAVANIADEDRIAIIRSEA